MHQRRYALVGLLLLILALAACGGGGGGAKKDPPSASRPAADLRVTDKREIEIEDGRILSLSPNGEWLVVDKGELLCIYQAASLAEQSCALLKDRAHPALGSLTWSPQGTRVAFADDAVRMMVESDLWVLEAETGKLSNLTDDGATGNLLRPEPEGSKPLVDAAPAWSPDGKTLVFVRSARVSGAWDGTALYRISAGGGDPKKLLAVAEEEPLVVWWGTRWSGDGKKILYTVAGRESDAPDNGIWIVEGDGKNPQHILGVTDPDLGSPFLVDVAAKGDKALIWYYMAASRFGAEPNVSYFAILDLKTGEVEPLKRARGEEIEFSSPSNAILSPDGSKLLYAYRDLIGGEFRLVVRDVDGETENVLLISEEPLGASFQPGLGLNWAENDTLYVATFGRTHLLLTLASE
jgi:hypothetical protein